MCRDPRWSATSHSAGQDPTLFTTYTRWGVFTAHRSSCVSLSLFLISFRTSAIITASASARILSVNFVPYSSKSQHSCTMHSESRSSNIDVTTKVPMPDASSTRCCHRIPSFRVNNLECISSSPVVNRAAELEKCLGHLSTLFAISPRKETSQDPIFTSIHQHRHHTCLEHRTS